MLAENLDPLSYLVSLFRYCLLHHELQEHLLIKQIKYFSIVNFTKVILPAIFFLNGAHYVSTPPLSGTQVTLFLKQVHLPPHGFLVDVLQ